MIYLTRRYRFSASHRLHQASLSAEENRKLYGKCDNPYGHGHNYVLEVTVAGEIEPSTGMVADPSTLDRAVAEEILEPFDYSYLNLDVERFRDWVPTTENVCVEIYRRLEPRLGGQGKGARLARVRLEETNSNFFEYAGGKTIEPAAGSVSCKGARWKAPGPRRAAATRWKRGCASCCARWASTRSPSGSRRRPGGWRNRCAF